MANICPQCGANTDMVGRVHRCVPVPAELASDGSVPKPVPGEERKLMGKKKSYAYRDPDKRREYMRNYMKEYRNGETKRGD